MKKYFALLSMALSVLVVFTGCGKEPIEESFICPDLALETENYPEEKDYFIYNLIIDKYYKDGGLIHVSQKNNAYIDQIIEPNNYIEKIQESQVDFDTSLVAEYVDNNKSEYFFGPKFNSPAKVISVTELRCLFTNSEPDPYSNYYKKYSSSGILKFFQVGYDQNNEFAIVEYHHGFGGLGAYGWLVLLKNENGNWSILDRIMLWVS